MTPAQPTVAIPGPRMIELPEFADDRGRLVPAEAADLRCSIERVYWIAGVPPRATRGGHAHRRTVEVIAAAAGTFSVRCDDGSRRTDFPLRAGGGALIVPPLVWREVMDFSPGAVCLVLASERYDEDEYVRDPEEFRMLVRGS